MQEESGAENELGQKSAVFCMWPIQAGRVFFSCEKFQNRNQFIIQKAKKISEMFRNCKSGKNPVPQSKT